MGVTVFLVCILHAVSVCIIYIYISERPVVGGRKLRQLRHISYIGAKFDQIHSLPLALLHGTDESGLIILNVKAKVFATRLLRKRYSI